jgi:transient receptor potential cation channel subfamily M protein 2
LLYALQEKDNQKKDMTKNTDVLLDPNHTHFILVDDGTEGQFGKEIEFRSLLEAELRKGKSIKYYEKKRNQKKKVLNQLNSNDSDSDTNHNGITETIPMILIVVQGGPNTLITVEHSLKQSVPVLVLAVSDFKDS